VPEGKPPAPVRTCKAAEAITTRAAGLRSRALGGPPGWSAQAARLPGAQSRNSNWARYRKEISDNIKNSRLAVVLGFGPAPRWARPIHFQKPARTPEPAALFLSWASRVFLSVWELRHITLPRIDLHCRSSRTATRRQWRVLFEKRPSASALPDSPVRWRRSAGTMTAVRSRTHGWPS
jgi:hypothetical protein